jgi:hypothetical protein
MATSAGRPIAMIEHGQPWSVRPTADASRFGAMLHIAPVVELVDVKGDAPALPGAFVR